ncbi:pyridoxal-phosphate dependent enzyme [Fodinicola feengrottensis]|uniref:pyridoxal-phosphate dependent enzyme n=1 Tax=Fodinicola feengrottensis TaxID=435914 RepID=UPI002441A07B|nr:pyridoxal-phosphate dependent enzyme [Fodinicola feengrottensis]
MRAQGRRPYVIPRGGSDHPLGGLGYVLCASEIAIQSAEWGVEFDTVLHCTGSSGTQAGLLAGFAALDADTRVIGVSDDGHQTRKRERVLRLANATLAELGLPNRIGPERVEIVVADESPYGVASDAVLAAVRLFATTEGLVADPVYEGRRSAA